jgi:hypothetical protein
MSWDIYFEKNGETVMLDEPLDIRGGTYCMGGTREAWLNVTWNYGKHFRFGELDKKTAAEAIMVLVPAALRLNASDTDPDYWKPTEGNVRRAIENLLTLARSVPADSVIRIS